MAGINLSYSMCGCCKYSQAKSTKRNVPLLLPTGGDIIFYILFLLKDVSGLFMLSYPSILRLNRNIALCVVYASSGPLNLIRNFLFA